MADQVPPPPEGTPLTKAVVHRNITSIPDVYRHYAIPDITSDVIAAEVQPELTV